MELWAQGSTVPAVKFGSLWQRFHFMADSSGTLAVAWTREGDSVPRTALSTPISTLGVKLSASASAELSLGAQMDSGELVSASAHAPGWVARFATLGTVTLTWRDSSLDLRAPPEICAAVARWLGAQGCAIPGLVTYLDSASGGDASVPGGSSALMGLSLIAPGAIAADVALPDAAAACSDQLGALASAAPVLAGFAGAAVSVLGKVRWMKSRWALPETSEYGCSPF